MIDMSKPYFVIERVEKAGDGTDSVEVSFRVNGCVNLDSASVVINGDTQTLVRNGYCNQLLNSRSPRPVQ